MEKLYRLVNALLYGDGAESIVAQLPDKLVEIFEADGVALYDKHTGQIFRSGPRSYAISDHALRGMALRVYQLNDSGSAFFLAPIRHSEETGGSIGIRGAGLSQSLLNAVVGRVGMGLARLYAIEKATDAEVARVPKS